MNNPTKALSDQGDIAAEGRESERGFSSNSRPFTTGVAIAAERGEAGMAEPRLGPGAGCNAALFAVLSFSAAIKGPSSDCVRRSCSIVSGAGFQ